MRLIGLMSGTSVDGIDAALVEIDDGCSRPQVRLAAFLCVAWSDAMRSAILDACRPDAPAQQVTVLSFALGEAFADAAAKVAAAAGFSLDSVDAIASHGQTIWHQPTPLPIGGVFASGTLQIGEPSVIAARTGRPVVADFRCADLALGGQGAPLVPFADHILFQHATETRVVQNLGGIANVTLLPAGGSLDNVIAFDTGPANLLLDHLAHRITGGAQRFDVDGALAATGTVNRSLLNECLSEPYFSLAPPKSTGRELFGAAYAESFLRRARSLGCRAEDILATATALTAESIADAYRRWILPHGEIQTAILGGGGVHNRSLVRMLADRLAPARLTTHIEFGIPDDAKEAIAFALLGHATLSGRPSNVPSATGATGPALLGKIILPVGAAKFRLI